MFICLFFTNVKLIDIKFIDQIYFCPLSCQEGDMFKHNYQGGAGVEVFSGQGKDPVAKWKLSGGQSAIRKEYDKEMKGFVYCLEGSSKTVKMQMPANGKMSLGLLQRFLAIQVIIPQGKDFSVELVITDAGHLKRRLYLSTVHKELSVTLWHAKLPLAGVKRNIWTTLFVDLVSFTGELFKAAEFLSLDGITLFASCKLRRIFTVKTAPTILTDDDMLLSGASVMDQIPRNCQFPPNVCHDCQLLNMAVLQKATLRTANANTDCEGLHDQIVQERMFDDFSGNCHSRLLRRLNWFRSITNQVFHRAHAFLLMYDITSSQSFTAVHYWAKCIQEGAMENVPVLLLGNKSDHVERHVTTEEGQSVAQKLNADFLECSAVSGDNVIQSLEAVARLLSHKDDRRDETPVLQKAPPKKKPGCC